MQNNTVQNKQEQLMQQTSKKWVVKMMTGNKYIVNQTQYELIKKAITNANIKMIHFKNFSLNISSISEIELYSIKEIKDYYIEYPEVSKKELEEGHEKLRSMLTTKFKIIGKKEFDKK